MSRFIETSARDREMQTSRFTAPPINAESASSHRPRFNFSNTTIETSPQQSSRFQRHAQPFRPSEASPIKSRFGYLRIQEPQSSDVEITDKRLGKDTSLPLLNTRKTVQGLPSEMQQLFETVFDNPYLHRQLRGYRKGLKKHFEPHDRTQLYQRMGGLIFQEAALHYRDTTRQPNTYLLKGRELDKLFSGGYMQSYFDKRPDPQTTPDFIEITDNGDYALLTAAGEIGSHLPFERWWELSDEDGPTVRQKKKQMQILETGLVMEHFLADSVHTDERRNHVHEVISGIHPELADKPILYDPEQYHMEVWLPEGTNSKAMILNGTVNEAPIKLATINKLMPSLAIDLVHSHQSPTPPIELFPGRPVALSGPDLVAGGDY